MAERFALVNGTVIDGTGAEPREGLSVVVEDDLIVDLAAAGKEQGVGRRIDCTGMTVLPGLIDAHVHVGAVLHDIQNQHRLLPPSLVAIRMGKRMEMMLRCGFTTVRDAGGADLGMKMAVETGDVLGPRLLVPGRAISQTGGHGDQRT